MQSIINAKHAHAVPRFARCFPFPILHSPPVAAPAVFPLRTHRRSARRWCGSFRPLPCHSGRRARSSARRLFDPLQREGGIQRRALRDGKRKVPPGPQV